MLTFQSVTKRFETLDGIKTVFEDLNITIETGEFISVIGANGAGKSTFVRLVSGDLLPDVGEVSLDGKGLSLMPLHLRKRLIGKVYQDPAMGAVSRMTVMENLSMADRKGQSFGLGMGLNRKGRPRYEAILGTLEMGLENHLDTEVRFLSGGQRQALALVMATLVTPRILILDEHTAALDPKSAQMILQKTAELVQAEKITTIMITHSLNAAIQYGERLLLFSGGQVRLDVKGEEKKALTPQILMPYYVQEGSPSPMDPNENNKDE